MQHFLWSSHGSAIREAASKLQEDATQVDVYLHTTLEAAEGTTTTTTTTATTTQRTHTKKKKNKKDLTSFPAHRLILAAASPFLNKVLSEHYLDHRDACIDITIPHVLPEALHCILDFLYCGTTGIPSAIRDSVLEAADLLEIKHLTNCYPSTEKFEGLGEPENTLPDKENSACEASKTESMILEQGRDGKKLNEEKYVCSSVLKGDVQVKKEHEVDTGNHVHAGIMGTRRRRRKVKSKYSADLYEVTVPRTRKWKRRKMSEKEPTVQNSTETFENDVFEDTEKYTVPNLPSSFMEIDQKSHERKLNNSSVSENTPKDFTTDSAPSVCDPSSSVALSFTEKNNKSLIAELPLTLTSTSSSSVIIPNIFVADQSYLPDSDTKPEFLAEISCASSLVQEDSTVLNGRSLEPPSVAVASAPPSSLLSEVKELPLVAPPSSMTTFPMKQVTSFTHHKISETLKELKNEDDQEGGIFRFQVLLKECDDFPDEVCPVPQSSQGNRGDSQPGKDSIDINQWISEEMQSCVMPSTEECEKESSPHDAPGEDLKREQLLVEETRNLDSANDKNKDFECAECGKTFSDQRSCQSHKRGVHDEAKQMCRYCGKMFRRRCDLYQHERRHRTASLPCTYCGKIFKLAKDLQAHITTHIGGKRFQCIHCDKELTSYRNLKNHIASIHQNHRPFTCQLCKKAYSKATSLQVHIRSVHTGERPFKCSACGKTFCDASLLRNHQAVHTGERKYSCKVCGRPFRQYSNMISHQRIHTNTRPFLCPICEEEFKTKEGLLRHRWLHTGLKPLRCSHCCQEFRIKERYEKHMLKCHNEVTNLPDIFFEVSDEVVPGEEDNTSPTCDIEVIRGTVKEEETLEETKHDQMLDGGLSDGGSTENLSPVVHLVSSNMPEQEITSEEPSHVQLSYPLLTSAAGLEESDITLGNLSGQISCSEPVEPLDVDSLLNSEGTASSGALIIASREKEEVLPPTITDSAVRDCEEVVILTKVSEDIEETGQEMDAQPTIKLWIL